MGYALVVSTILILVLLYLLVVGEPAAQNLCLQTTNADATQIVTLKRQIPTPTAVSCWMMGHC